MTEKEKILKALERCDKCMFPSVFGDQSAYLECEYTIGIYCGQDNLKRKTLMFLKEQPEIVRCKDCKHRPKEIPFTTTWGGHDTYLEFPEGSRCPCQCSGDSYYSWNPDDDWFCADGERKDDE